MLLKQKEVEVLSDNPECCLPHQYLLRMQFIWPQWQKPSSRLQNKLNRESNPTFMQQIEGFSVAN